MQTTYGEGRSSSHTRTSRGIRHSERETHLSTWLRSCELAPSLCLPIVDVMSIDSGLVVAVGPSALLIESETDSGYTLSPVVMLHSVPEVVLAHQVSHAGHSVTRPFRRNASSVIGTMLFACCSINSATISISRCGKLGTVCPSTFRRRERKLVSDRRFIVT